MTTSRHESVRNKSNPPNLVGQLPLASERFAKGTRAARVTASTIDAEGGKADVAIPLRRQLLGCHDGGLLWAVDGSIQIDPRDQKLEVRDRRSLLG
jgi:hypothetical protein